MLTRNAKAVEAVWRGQIVGMVAYDGWTPSSAMAHMAVVHPIVWRRLLPAVFEYPFKQLGLDVLIGVVPGDNAKSLRMCERLGFRVAHRVVGGWSAGVDLVVHEMRRNECRYVR